MQAKPPASAERPKASCAEGWVEAVEADADPKPTEATDWAPDGVIHRLVELLMEMRGLSVAVPAVASPAAEALAA
jgi:hypothetical protein